MITVEQKWEEFRKLCWHHLDPKSVQMETIKQTFYAAWLDSMSTFMELVGEDGVSEERGAEIFGALMKEVKTWMQEEVERNLHKSKMPFIIPRDER